MEAREDSELGWDAYNEDTFSSCEAWDGPLAESYSGGESAGEDAEEEDLDGDESLGEVEGVEASCECDG